MSASRPLLELRGLEVAYGGIRAVRSIDLRVERGEMLKLEDVQDILRIPLLGVIPDTFLGALTGGDILQTLFLNMFYGGKMKGMPPKLMSDDGKHIVIRPLAYVKEKDLIKYAELKQFPIIPCNLCGSQENLKRQEVSRMIQEWDRQHPGRSWNVFNALSRVVPSHLMDRDLFDFVGLKPTGVPDANGDTAFDAVDPEADGADACGDTAPQGMVEKKVTFSRPGGAG